ncbi:hypothetical protein RclHR1_05540001 [Rhizophagus clarus]|uniref:Protein kinase domain-containing protein n=1 Tax=Rhizophagus clarus TaxID=94130 RepID=A0A2Z6RMF3_9GLOM|nr:hypothetical protein RclHR1_05540001 [Rhizophagus clarus]
MSIEENIEENTQLINKYDVIEPKFGIFKTSDYDLSLKERRAKYNNFDVILCEDCNKETNNYYCYCTYCYNKETDINKKRYMKFGSNVGTFNTSDYNLNLKERRAKYKNFDGIICGSCDNEIYHYNYYCTYCYNKETDIIEKIYMKYGSNFEVLNISDYNLDLKERRAKYKNFDGILCKNCNKEIDNYKCYCTYCYNKETDINKKFHMKYGSNFGILYKSDYNLDVIERKAKNIYFDIILCENCYKEIDNYNCYCTYCYDKETDINKRNHMKYGLNFGVFKGSDYYLSFEERKLKYMNFNVILCEKCHQEIDKQVYYCTFCYNEETLSTKKQYVKYFKTSDYNLNLEERIAKFKKKINKPCLICYNKITNIKKQKYGSEYEIFKTSDYDLNLEKRESKYKDFKIILCEECGREIDKQVYYCLICYNKITDINKQNHMKYGSEFEIFKTSDYDLNLEKRKAKYKDYKVILCETCDQKISKHYYYCLICYNKITNINKRNHMKYGLNFEWFKTSDYDLNLEKRKAKYKDFKIILCEKCNREIDKQLCYCKYCFIKELNYDKKVQMKCVLKTGILKTSDYDLSINEKQTKFENCDSIICEKCNCEIINLHYYRCDKCYSKAGNYERWRMTFGICKHCFDINTTCNCLPSLNQLIKEFEKFNEIYESKVNGNSIFKQPITIISDYDLNEDDRREKCKDYYDILCEKCNKIFSFNDYCHSCDDEKEKKLKELQSELRIFENFYNELYDKETNNLKNSNELRLIIQSNKYIYPKVNRFEGIHLQIKKVITEYIMPIKSELIAIKQSPEVCFHTIRSYCDCYYMETDISEKKRMEFGKCKECLNIHEDLNGCLSCNPQRFQRDFNKWTSGNEIIDRLIQENQLLVRRYGLLEWIPYDRFTNINYIAEGGFAKVYSATWIDGQIKKWSQLSNNWRRNGSTVVALKVLNSSENISEDFLNEALSGYMCVIKCFGITQDPITYDYALVLQYMENGDLRKYLKRTINTLTWKRRMSNIYDICLAIDNIHKHRLMHKDLHPGNIFIDSTFAYIGDFGFCMPANENIKNSTKKNIYGVLPYMAPEILRGKPHTLASDIYSLGVIINEIITVIPPFNNQPHDLYLALDICRGLRPNIRSETPDSLKELIKKCWDAKPENRPTSKEILCKLSDNLSEYKNIPIIRLSYNLNESNEIQLHPLASYTSRLLNFQNLPEPINCPNQQEFTSSRYMKIQTGQVNILRSNECSDCIIVNTD